MNLIDYILENDYVYVDIDGANVFEADWSPESLNENPSNKYIRGLNSLQILSYLTLSFSISGNSLYADAFQYLFYSKGYYTNALNQKLESVYGDNHRHNELSFMAYHTLFYSHFRLDWNNRRDVDESLRRNLKQMVMPMVASLQRWYSIVEKELSPLWLVAFVGPTNLRVDDENLKIIIESLKDSPTNLIDYGVKHSNRWDCVPQPYGDMGNSTEQLFHYALSSTERQILSFDSNPFLMDSKVGATSDYNSGGGYAEYPPTLWVLPYWMLRFYKVI